MNPLLEGLKRLGGSATIEEIVNIVAEIVGLSEEQLQVPHGDKGRSESEYRLAWTRTYLKGCGLLENSSRGVWSLTAQGNSVGVVDPRHIQRTYLGKQTSTSATSDEEVLAVEQ